MLDRCFWFCNENGLSAGRIHVGIFDISESQCAETCAVNEEGGFRIVREERINRRVGAAEKFNTGFEILGDEPVLVALFSFRSLA